MPQCLALFVLLFPLQEPRPDQDLPVAALPAESLPVEVLSGEGVWVDPALLVALNGSRTTPVVVWFDRQLLGDGAAYARRSEEWSDWQRSALRTAAIATLKQLSLDSWSQAEPALVRMSEEGQLKQLGRLWIVNGFHARISIDALEGLKLVPGVKKVFLGRRGPRGNAANRPAYPDPAAARPAPDPAQPASADSAQGPSPEVRHPWYSHQLMAVRAWEEFGYRGEGVLNIVHDFNFQYTPGMAANLYANPGEVAGNGKDDDGNGLVDDVHGYDFTADSDRIFFGPGMHGFLCANVLCGQPSGGHDLEYGVAPASRWAGVIGPIELCVQWAAEQGADTYSMSFSIPGLGDGRSHWRKVLEHGSLCGIYFASGAGNFGQRGSRNFAPIPRQMRTPEDIPRVVFAATGVHRDLSETVFASKGPVVWQLEHYQEGQVQKPEVCAFNFNLPRFALDGGVEPGGSVSGNSLAGPMSCASIALLLSADPELLPAELTGILTATATDIGPPGVDFQTGHGLINVYRAMQEVLRRKAVAQGQDAGSWNGRRPGDQFDAATYQAWGRRLGGRAWVTIAGLGEAAQLAGLQVGDRLQTVNDQEIRSREDLHSVLASLRGQKGFRVGVGAQRNGAQIALELDIQDMEIQLKEQVAAASLPVFW